MNQESLGKLFKNGDIVYKCVAYADTPTITMQNIETGEKINMCVNSILAACFEEVIEDNKEIAGKKHAENNVNFEALINELRYYREHPWNEIEDNKKIEKIKDKLDITTCSICDGEEKTNELIDKINEIIEVLNDKD